jgi:ABC-type glycerol-3-phosphate transport system permease component
MLVTLMIPCQSSLIPWYLLMAQLGWLNTFLPALDPVLGAGFWHFPDAPVHRVDDPD